MLKAPSGWDKQVLSEGMGDRDVNTGSLLKPMLLFLYSFVRLVPSFLYFCTLSYALSSFSR